MMKNLTIVFCIVLMSASGILAEENDVLFAQDTVWDVHLTFPYDNFIDSLLWTHDADSYIAATFQWEDVTVDSVGVKFKGNSSFQIPSNKKSLKIDFNSFIDDQTFLELKKLNLNNCFKDPTFLREKLMIEIINQYIPSIRCSYARVYLNDHYWGLYTLVEQVDKTFCQSRFGSSEDGNLYKGDPHGALRWQGSDPEPYRQNYEKVTNEDEDDWTDLIDLIDILNNTPLESLDDSLGSRFQLVEWLKFTAVNNFLVNLDSYLGSAHNYFLYHREDIDKFIHLPWDMNEAFGTFRFGLNPGQLTNMSIFWDPPPPHYRPLIVRPFQIDEIRDIYRSIYALILEEVLHPNILSPRIDELADLIRDNVYADSLKHYSNEAFEINLEEDIPAGPNVTFGLKSFLQTRYNIVSAQLEGTALLPPMAINEFMASNATAFADESGEYDDWIELANPNYEDVDISGWYISDDLEDATKFEIPEGTVLPAEGFLILWADKEEDQGALHLNFKLDADGEAVILIHPDGIGVADSVSFDIQMTNVSAGRIPNYFGEWQNLEVYTPGTFNDPAVSLSDDPLPRTFTLAVYPNPFNPITTLRYELPENSLVTITIYDMLGKELKTLINQTQDAGYNSVIWNATNDYGKPVSAGIYLCQIKAGEYISIKKMVLLK